MSSYNCFSLQLLGGGDSKRTWEGEGWVWFDSTERQIEEERKLLFCAGKIWHIWRKRASWTAVLHTWVRFGFPTGGSFTRLAPVNWKLEGAKFEQTNILSSTMLSGCHWQRERHETTAAGSIIAHKIPANAANVSLELWHLLLRRNRSFPFPDPFPLSVQSGAAYRSWGFGRWGFGEFPRLVGRYGSYLLPKQARWTAQILIFKTSRPIGRPAL